MAQKAAELVGCKFGKLEVLEAVRVQISVLRWLCSCSCGKTTIQTTEVLTKGRVRSCGCGNRETQRARLSANAQHGEARRGKLGSEYRSWLAMKARCSNPANTEYRFYGGRGIKVCALWQNNFEAFLADVGRKPTPKHSIERIENHLGYEPGNCRWATMAEQCRNRRSTRLIQFNGETLCITDWAARLGIPYKTLHRRLSRGWSVQEAFTAQVLKPESQTERRTQT